MSTPFVPGAPYPGTEALPATSKTDLPPSSVAVVLGTRPELIKLSVLIRLLGPAARVVHTGQHYAPVLAAGMLHELGLPVPAVQLRVGGRSRGEQIGETVTQLTALWAADPPRVVVVHGDTNATVAGALAANCLGLPLVHVEAGLRSHDRRMPEEHNRVVVDHLADLCCAPTLGNVGNLCREGIPDDRIALTGNTIVEALACIERDHAGADQLLQRLSAPTHRVVLVTLHRPENVDDPERLRSVLIELADVGAPVLLVLHPRTQERVHRFGLAQLLASLHVTGPVGYAVFLSLAERAALLVSDSGGIQEEATVLGKRLLVLRRSTERPEALDAGTRLVGAAQQLGELVVQQLAELAGSPGPRQPFSPFGDGTASHRVLSCLVSFAAMPSVGRNR